MPLLLHCGALSVDRNNLIKAKTPKATRTWVPLPHFKLLNIVEQGLAEGGFQITEEAHGLSHEGKRYFGLLGVKSGQTETGCSWVIGLRNSHDQRFSAGVIAGARVLVCDNLSFCGDVKLEHKHTRSLESHMNDQMPEVIAQLNEFWQHQEQRIQRYRDYVLNDTSAHDLIIRAVDARICSNRLIPVVLKEWRQPRHEEFQPRTAWSLFNGFTEALKGHIFELPGRTDALHHLFDGQIGIPADHGSKGLVS